MKERKVSIRPVCEEDLPLLADLRNEVREYLGNNDIVGMAGQKDWFNKITNDLSVRYFIIESTNFSLFDREESGIGMVRITYIDMVNRSACVGGDILLESQGKGYGVAMMEAIKKYCFEVLNLRRLWLFVLDTNERAKRLYKKSGFKREGVQREAIWRGGKYVDYVMMSLIRREEK